MNDTTYRGATEELINLLIPAIERWRQGDPMGYAELFSDQATYFGPLSNGPIIGREALREHFQPIVGLIQVPKMDHSNQQLQIIGECRILCCNWVEFDDQGEAINTWSSSEVWAHIDGRWQIMHAHWSLVETNA